MRALWSGSPPRMRGKVAGGVIIGVLLGITPAYAGKRVRDSFCKDIRWDHPRVCGEKPRRGSGLNLILGSPPRMRGKGSADVRTGQRTGITPAYAGKSPPAERSGPIRWDHPRVCGEKYQDKNGNKRTAGITPAYAGKSHCHPGQCGRNGDHPRVCGEKTKKIP